VCKAKKGDTIITQGQPGDWFYVVSSRSFDVVIDGP
jgi:CRP-like cAMP-binding protein